MSGKIAVVVLATLMACVAVQVPADASPDAAGAAPEGSSAETSSLSFTDVAPGHPFFSDIQWLVEAGITEGYIDGSFGPMLPVTRQAMAAFLYRFAEGSGKPAGCEEAPFSDVPADHPFCPEIAWLAAQGITMGFGDDTFGPDLPVSRQAMSAFLYREAGSPEGEAPTCESQPFADVPADHPFCPEIAWLAAGGVSVGFPDGAFGTDGAIARQAMAAFMQRLALLDDPGTPIPSAGCGTSTAASGTKMRMDIQVDGEDRWFLLTVPSAHDGDDPVPLVVDFHGLSEGANLHTTMTEYSDHAMVNGFAVAFPQGTGSPSRWDVGAEETNPDLAFTDAILDTLGAELCLDEARFYVTGLSFGGFMTSRLACSRSSRFAAVAPVAGVVMPEPCNTERPVPLLTFHGTDDKILSYDGGVGPDAPSGGAEQATAEPSALEPPRNPTGVDLTRPVPEQVAAWAARNNCLPNPVDTQITDEVIHRVYRCPVGSAVELYIVIGGGHAWPGSAWSKAIAFAVGYTTFDIVATELSWEFFQRFHLPSP